MVNLAGLQSGRWKRAKEIQHWLRERHAMGLKLPCVYSALRDTENVPLSEDVETYFKREVLPHAPDAWIDHEKTQVGHEIPFNRHFYVFQPPRPLSEIDAELKGVTDRILKMIGGLTQ